MNKNMTAENTTAESFLQIIKAYDQAETEFHNSKAYGDHEAIKCIIEEAVDDHVIGFEVNLEKNAIRVGIKDREGDHGVYVFRFDKFFTTTPTEITDHDDKLMLEIASVKALNRQMTTVEYNRMQNLDISAQKAEIAIELPKWYLEDKALINANKALIKELEESKIKSFHWR
jgi:hypothetical protein